MTLGARARFALALVVVPSLAALVAHVFRLGVFRAAEVIGGDRSAIRSLASNPFPLRFGVVFAGIVAAAVIGRAVARRFPGRTGIPAIASAARDGGPGPEPGATAARTAATFAASASLVSIGREAAVLEASGVLGFVAGRLLRVDAHRESGGPATSALAASGIAAAFAASYHAPMAGLLYVEEHLGVRRRPLAAGAAAVGSIVGYVVSLRVFESKPLFAAVAPSQRLDVVTSGLAVLLPTLVAGRVFRSIRRRVAAVSGADSGRSRWLVVAAVGAALIAFAPNAAGNGMEAIRATALPSAAVGLFVAMAVVKLLATSAVLGSGAPGGVFSPAMAISVGWALLALQGAHALGVSTATDVWPAVLAAMTIGIAIGFQAPLVAMFAVAEMTGDVRLMPYTATLVGAAWLVNRGLDAAVEQVRSRTATVDGPEAEG